MEENKNDGDYTLDTKPGTIPLLGAAVFGFISIILWVSGSSQSSWGGMTQMVGLAFTLPVTIILALIGAVKKINSGGNSDD